MKKNNKLETEVALISQKVKTLTKILTGNGTNGMLKKMDELFTETIPEMRINMQKMESYSHIKNWVLGGAVAILVSVCSFLIAHIFRVGG